MPFENRWYYWTLTFLARLQSMPYIIILVFEFRMKIRYWDWIIGIGYFKGSLSPAYFSVFSFLSKLILICIRMVIFHGRGRRYRYLVFLVYEDLPLSDWKYLMVDLAFPFPFSPQVLITILDISEYSHQLICFYWFSIFFSSIWSSYRTSHFSSPHSILESPKICNFDRCLSALLSSVLV